MTDQTEAQWGTAASWEDDYWELFLRHAELWTLVAEMVWMGDD